VRAIKQGVGAVKLRYSRHHLISNDIWLVMQANCLLVKLKQKRECSLDNFFMDLSIDLEMS